MIKRLLLMLAAVGLVLGGVFGFIAFKNQMIRQAIATQSGPPPTVSATIARRQDWLPKVEAVGTVRAVRGAEISAEVPGLLSQVHFSQGGLVAEGTPLAQLRADDERARLQALQAAAELATATLRRAEAQFEVKAISQQAVDVERANLRIALANVHTQQALLAKKTIRAPFAGVVGLRLADAGQYLEAGKPITTLQQLDTVYIDFWLPQQQLAVLRPGQAVEATTDAHPGQTFTGTVAAINPKVDAATRNVQVRATFANPGRHWLPGMFAKVWVITGKARPSVTLPRTAISFSPQGASVFVLDSRRDGDGKPHLVARQVQVATGASRGDHISVLEGVADGEQVVTSGQIKLHDGAVAVVDDRPMPGGQPSPQPMEQ